MSHNLLVYIADRSPMEFVLSNGKYQIGSHASCDVCIPFEEVASVAAHVEVRGEAVFLRNMNPFPIYVGEYELGANQQGEWPIGQTVLLTTSVSLSIQDSSKRAESDREEAAAKRTRSTLQIAVVVACVGLGYVLLTSDDKTPASTQALYYNFTSLIEELQDLPRPSSQEEVRQRRTVLNYLIDARVPDVRWGAEDPRRAISAYELLLDLPAIRKASDQATTEGRIRQYALARVSDLSAAIVVEP